MSLRAINASYSLSGRLILDRISIEVRPGRLLVVLGPNGAGKSTLLRVLAGELRPQLGRVELDGRRLGSWDARALAQRRAVMMQREHLPFSLTAREVTALGRLPWTGGADSAAEQAIVDAALQSAGASLLSRRRYPTLSGGERARVQLARALAQLGRGGDGAQFLLLDEPTASFDFAFQHHCLSTVLALSRRGVGVMAILQDPNLALRYADDVAVLDGGRLLALGPPAEVLTPTLLDAVYGLQTERYESASGPFLIAHLSAVGEAHQSVH